MKINITEKAKRHPAIFWLTVIGSLTSIIGLFLWFLPSDITSSSPPKLRAKNKIEINKLELSSRAPVWGNASFSEDEIVVNVIGTSLTSFDNQTKYSLVPFWRLGNAYETNWHVGRRRVGGNYILVSLSSKYTSTGEWEFLVGGIECKKEYEGDVAVVLLALPADFIDNNYRNWLDDNIGWGYKELPLDASLNVSNSKVFKTHPIRK